MNRKAAVILPVLIGLVIISLALAAGAFYFYQKEHAKNIQLQTQITELTARQRITEDKLEESKKQATEFQLKLQEARAQVEILTQQVDGLTNDLTQERTARLKVVNSLDQINTDLKQQKVLRQDLEDKLNQSEAEGKKIKDQIKVITQEKTDLEAKIKNLKSGAGGVELGKVVVNLDKESANQPIKEAEKFPNESSRLEKKAEESLVKPLEGKISVVNKEFNFAVINLGSKNDVKIGDEFSVMRRGKVVGNLKVEKVHEAMSAAGFAAEFKDNIKENDVVQKVK